VDQIRARSGIREGEILTETVRERVRQLNGEQPGPSNQRPLVTVAVAGIAIRELERGGFFGVGFGEFAEPGR
jgi:hypothetical protein